MALKDWDKDSDTSSYISYINPKSSQEIKLEITNYGNSGTFGRKKADKWSVFKFRNNKPIAIIKNVSKDKAILKAKSYMRNN